MQISIAFQTLVFLQAILLGICLGAGYDLLRAIRSVAPRAMLTAVCDGIFWLLVLVSGFVFVLTAAQGNGRAYIALGAVLGGILYAISFSPLLYGVLYSTLCTIRRFIQRLRTCIRKYVQELRGISRSLRKKIYTSMKKVLSFFPKKG